MLKIGEFARLSHVSLKTLRHYDTLGLLRPSHTDPENGYRLYDLDQLAEMMRILALKDCGFALEEIAHLLQTHDVKTLEVLLQQRVIAQHERVGEEQARLGRLMARVKQLAMTRAAVPPYDVALKRTEPLTLLGLRQQVATPEEIGPFARTVVRRFEQQAIIPVGTLIHLYFDENPLDEGFDLFVGTPIVMWPPALPDLHCLRLAGGEQVACVLYRGEYTAISDAYIALNHWLTTSGNQRSGPGREIYHRSPLDTEDAASYLTEIQYPIQEVFAKS